MSMTLEELGLVLRSEREKRNLSLDDVAETLKVSAKVLRGIEAGDKESLPHAVYVRGFILSYGKMLGLDTSEFLTIEGLYDADEVHVAQYKEINSIHTSRGKGPIILIVVVFLCALGAALVWAYRDADLFSKLQSEHLTTAQPAPPLPSASAPVAPSNADAATTENTSAANTNTETAASLATQSEAAPKEEAKPEDVVEEKHASEDVLQLEQNQSQSADLKEEEPLVAAQNTEQQRQDGPHKVIITSVAPCWIHSTADNTDTRQFSLDRGDTFALTFTEELVLKLGNAGGVRIHYNGKELPPPGKDGQVKTLRFPIE